MNKKSSKIILTTILVLYVLVMIVGAIIPNPQDVPIFSGNTKYFHFFGFILLSIIVFKTFELYNFKHRYILSTVCLIGIIILTEFLQLFVSSRHYSYTDMLIDAAGCLIGFLIYKSIVARKK